MKADNKGFIINGITWEGYEGTDKELIVPDGVEKVGGSALGRHRLNVTSIILPDSVREIVGGTFAGSRKLKEITIPEGVTSLPPSYWGEGMFKGCFELETVNLPKSLKSIGEYAFSRCFSLECIEIPESVTEIGNGAFSNCKKLRKVIIHGKIKKVGEGIFNNCPADIEVTNDDFLKKAVEKSMKIKGTKLVEYMGFGGDVVIPDGITEIDKNAFFGMDSINSITIPDSVEKIGKRAIFGIPDLEIKASDNVKEIIRRDSMVIKKNELREYNGNDTEVIVPDGIKTIAPNAFSQAASVKKILLPDSVKSIDYATFSYCEKLESINLPEGITFEGSEHFKNCASLKEIWIPDSVVKTGHSLFKECKSLTKVRLPETIRYVNGSLFEGCESLEHVTIPASVVEIHVDAFDGCTSLKTIEFLNPDIKLEDDVFGDEMPPELMKNCPEIYTHMKDAAIRRYILKKNIWQSIPVEIQCEIYTAKQGKTLVPMYPECIGDQVVPLGEEIMRKLEGKASVKECNIAATFMAQFFLQLPQELLKNMYTALENAKNGKKALQTLTDNTALMAAIECKSDDVQAADGGIEQKVFSFLAKMGWSAKDPELKLEEYYSLKLTDLAEVMDKEGNAVPPFVIAWLLCIHETLKEKDSYHGSRAKPDVVPAYEKPGVCPEAAEIIEMLDEESWNRCLVHIANIHLAIMVGRTKKMFLSYPLCRYLGEENMEQLTKRAPSWRSSVSGNDAPPLATFRRANAYSDTRAAMMFADKFGELDIYARIRGTDADTIRDQFLSDVGVDADGCKKYDLGNQVVTARLQSDLSFIIELENGKTAKSLPKKGADEEKHKAANADFSEMKKNVKKIVKNRSTVLFDDFLDDHERKASDWTAAYLNNPVLKAVAKLLVWSQNGNTFTIGAEGIVDVNGNSYAIDDSNIRLAHPMDMKAEEIEAWQKYFISNNLKQPFEQIWEPVVDKKTINEDRYKGCMVPYYRFLGQTKRGIIVEDLDFHAEIIITSKYCEINVERVDFHGHSINPDDRFEITSFKYKEFDRRINNTVAYFDKITAYDRVKNDDVTVANVLPQFTLAQISQFINLAGENNAVNVMAILLEYKNKHFADYDIMDEFSLEL